jgi:predicted site-specific integrase-resolvase
MNKDLINSTEAASLLGVDRATFNRWVTRGDVPIEVQYPGYKGGRLFRRFDVERVAKDKAKAKAQGKTVTDSTAA